MPGVYVSYPFCAQKCTYCNFASGVFPRELERRYHDALQSEIAGHVWNWVPETVYFGGGTPSQMPQNDLERILARIPGRPWRESTMEAAPGGISAAKAEGWRAAGINRVSLGVQSFVQQELARTGRKHTAEIVLREVAILREAGITNLNIDLIAGLPGQTLDSWRDSLRSIAELQPPHVSVYMLEVDEDSRLGKEVLFNGKRYGAPDVPSDNAIATMYEVAVEELLGLGIVRYEISNFALPGFESLHNLKYWRREPYVGFGGDAHSFDGEQRWQNEDSVEKYVAMGGNSRSLFTPVNAIEEKFFVGLRLAQGVQPEPQEWTHFAGPIGRFVAEGLLEQQGDRLRLTSRGIMLSNEVLAEFII